MPVIPILDGHGNLRTDAALTLQGVMLYPHEKSENKRTQLMKRLYKKVVDTKVNSIVDTFGLTGDDIVQTEKLAGDLLRPCMEKIEETSIFPAGVEDKKSQWQVERLLRTRSKRGTHVGDLLHIMICIYEFHRISEVATRAIYIKSRIEQIRKLEPQPKDIAEIMRRFWGMWSDFKPAATLWAAWSVSKRYPLDNENDIKSFLARSSSYAFKAAEIKTTAYHHPEPKAVLSLSETWTPPEDLELPQVEVKLYPPTDQWYKLMGDAQTYINSLKIKQKSILH
ncbi:MAG: hypothetical protein KJ621_03705 [Proteobacteria bacterium]|nr:hypothetical protein [Pseudomonadota bacterium]